MPAQKDFSLVPSIGNVPRSVFNRSHGHKTTFDMDKLIPFFVEEILPGDSMNLTANIFARISSPLKTPIMDNLRLNTYFFYCPSRLLWTNYEKFEGAQDDPGDSIDFNIPTVDIYQAGNIFELADHFGIPVHSMASETDMYVNALPFRMYNKIYNEWFRDENLQNSLTVPVDDGIDPYATYVVMHKSKKHDYFTSCLPYAQKPSTTVEIALAGTAPVIGDGTSIGFWNGTTVFGGYNAATDKMNMSAGHVNKTLPYNGSPGTLPTLNDAYGITTVASKSGMIADLASASTGIDINEFRLAVATQQLLEIDARGGTRFVEMIKAHYGITVPDFRLQRTEYLGGGKHTLNVNPVTQTSESGTTKQGYQTAHVTISGRSGFSKSFVEPGYIIGLVCGEADLNYQQGLDKLWTRSDRYDFYKPVFANLGEQPVLNKEIFWSGTPATDDAVFGYQEAWAEMRYKKSLVTGKFCSDASGTLDSWHVAQDFAATPTLNNTFITQTTPIDRVKAVDTEPDILFDSYIELRHVRPMPTYSVPGLRRL